MTKTAALFSAALLVLAAGSVSAADQPIVGAPSTIPHAVESYLPITADKNSCVMCHQLAKTDKAAKGEIPLSHVRDGKLAGERWSCTLCHAPSDAFEGKK